MLRNRLKLGKADIFKIKSKERFGFFKTIISITKKRNEDKISTLLKNTIAFLVVSGSVFKMYCRRAQN